MHGSIEGLASKRLLMHGAIGVAIKKATEFVLKLTDTSLRTSHKLPSKFLVIQPLATLNGIHEVTLNRIPLRKCHVIAALHHARTTAFAEQSLDDDGDR